jgi:polysaccharide biosynthesis protein PslJ
MTVAPALEETVPVDETSFRKADSVTLLSCYIFLLMIVPAWLVFQPLGAAGGPSTIFAVILFCWYLMTWLHPSLASRKGRQPVRSAGIFFGCAILATYVSVNRTDMSGLARNGADRGIIFMLGWVGVLLLVADGVDSLERLTTLLQRVVTAAATMGGIGIIQFLLGLKLINYITIPGLTTWSVTTDLLSRAGLHRPAATALDPLELSAVLVMTLPIAVHLARHAPAGLRSRRWLQVALISVALPMTVSRTAVVAFIVISLVLVPTWPKRDRRVAYLIILTGTLALWVVQHKLTSTFLSLFVNLGSDSSTTSRTGAWSSALPFIAQHPWFGRGFGTFFPATYFFTDDQYLLAMIETGVIGAFTLIMLFVTAWSTARRTRRLSSDPEIRQFAQSLAAAIAAGVVSFATLDAFSFPIASGLTFLLMGCTGAAWRLAASEKAPQA